MHGFPRDEMKPVDSTPLSLGTLSAAYDPVQRYFRSLEAGGQHPTPAVKLRVEDAYLMHLFASMHAECRSIVDLAGAATWGATAVLWYSRDRGKHVYVAVPAGGMPRKTG
jgi:hypothetical protein